MLMSFSNTIFDIKMFFQKIKLVVFYQSPLPYSMVAESRENGGARVG